VLKDKDRDLGQKVACNFQPVACICQEQVASLLLDFWMAWEEM